MINNNRTVPHLLYEDIYLNDATHYVDIYRNDLNELIASFGFYLLDSKSIDSGIYYRINTLVFKHNTLLLDYYAISSKHGLEVFKYTFNDFFEIFKKKKLTKKEHEIRRTRNN